MKEIRIMRGRASRVAHHVDPTFTMVCYEKDDAGGIKYHIELNGRVHSFYISKHVNYATVKRSIAREAGLKENNTYELSILLNHCWTHWSWNQGQGPKVKFVSTPPYCDAVSQTMYVQELPGKIDVYKFLWKTRDDRVIVRDRKCVVATSVPWWLKELLEREINERDYLRLQFKLGTRPGMLGNKLVIGEQQDTYKFWWKNISYKIYKKNVLDFELAMNMHPGMNNLEYNDLKFKKHLLWFLHEQHKAAEKQEYSFDIKIGYADSDESASQALKKPTSAYWVWKSGRKYWYKSTSGTNVYCEPAKYEDFDKFVDKHCTLNELHHQGKYVGEQLAKAIWLNWYNLQTASNNYTTGEAGPLPAENSSKEKEQPAPTQEATMSESVVQTIISSASIDAMKNGVDQGISHEAAEAIVAIVDKHVGQHMPFLQMLPQELKNALLASLLLELCSRDILSLGPDLNLMVTNRAKAALTMSTALATKNFIAPMRTDLLRVVRDNR